MNQIFENTVCSQVGRTAFADALLVRNGLDAAGFLRFVFFPGMLFESWHSWWGNGDFRPVTHEGLDLCLVESGAGQIMRFDDTIGVPAAFSGRVVRIMDDFLGQTVVIADYPESGQSAASRVLSFYAHVRPEKSVTVGDWVAAGQMLGRVAPIRSGKSPLPPHLHLSMARAEALPPVNELEWPVLNRADRRAFYDPLPVIGCKYRMKGYCPDGKDVGAFLPVGPHLKHR
ncbi:MAG: peptidoglycan DD-metalloendopeptidase family protein [Thermodesulfobacteriota bacterium]